MGHQIVQGAVLAQPFDRGLGTALAYPGHVVHRVPHKGQVIHDALGRHAKFSFHPGFVQGFVAHGIHQGDPGIHQLGHILIPGGNHHLQPLGRRLLGQGADHIVRLHPVHHEQGPASRLDAFVEGLDLAHQIHRHGGPLCFILRVPFVAERLAFGVENAGFVGDIPCLEVTFQPA